MGTSLRSSLSHESNIYNVFKRENSEENSQNREKVKDISTKRRIKLLKIT